MNIRTEEFLGGIGKYQTDISAIFARLTAIAPEQRKVVGVLKEKGGGEKVKVMVGVGVL